MSVLTVPAQFPLEVFSASYQAARTGNVWAKGCNVYRDGYELMQAIGWRGQHQKLVELKALLELLSYQCCVHETGAIPQPEQKRAKANWANAIAVMLVRLSRVK